MTRSVAEYCQEQELTLEGLTEKSGMPQDRVTAIVMGRWTPSPQEREKIATALGVTKEDISWGHKTPIQHIYGF